jgi:Rrf2 family protein
VRISHKVDYGVRVMTTIAEYEQGEPSRPVPRAVLAKRDDLPSGFLVDILAQLRNAGLLKSHRGGEGGWSLARPAEQITVADIIRALDGPLASVRGVRPHELGEQGAREPFISMWIAVRASLRSVLENITIADLASGSLPPPIARISADPDAWDPHRRTD